jgi:hypothetical protein
VKRLIGNKKIVRAGEVFEDCLKRNSLSRHYLAVSKVEIKAA